MCSAGRQKATRIDSDIKQLIFSIISAIVIAVYNFIEPSSEKAQGAGFVLVMLSHKIFLG